MSEMVEVVRTGCIAIIKDNIELSGSEMAWLKIRKAKSLLKIRREFQAWHGSSTEADALILDILSFKA